MVVLGIETSCDETAAALVEDGRVLSSEVSSSVHLHAAFGGVVPEIASRFHTEYIFSVVEKALKDSGRSIHDVELVAVTNGPGLTGSLLVGLAFAKAVSFARGIPIIGVNHLRAHLYSCFIGAGGMDDKFPFIGMVVSGGHTSIYFCRGIKDIEVMGRTRDDAVGEAFDKVAKIMDLGYPGGPIVEKRAAHYRGANPVDFPRAMVKGDKSLDLSFSGMKTAVMYHWKGCSKTEEEKDRICYSFQEAIMDVIVAKLKKAIKISGMKRLAVGGGVINNMTLRGRITRLCEEEGADLYLPEPLYCGDNAAMVAALGERLFLAKEVSDLSLGAASVMS
jgi:N6-L-threonylcarbamoyladenine synthase